MCSVFVPCCPLEVEEGERYPSTRSDVVNVPDSFYEAEGILSRLDTEVGALLADRRSIWISCSWSTC
eukprot:5756386-Amphidinium_carterae.1